MAGKKEKTQKSVSADAIAVAGIDAASVKKIVDKINGAKRELGKVVVGQDKIIDEVFSALLANGHVLVEGVPGIAKTLIIRSISSVSGCEFKRIQFTPDLLPSDITGITTYSKDRGFTVLTGPIFSNFVLADEINRAPPKVQSALLEAMQERQATIGRETYALPNPFFVLASQNPIESLGTYPLPQAQIDRFLYKILISYPSIEEERSILSQNMTLRKFDEFGVKPILSPQDIIEMQGLVKRVKLSPEIEQYIVRLVDATRFPKKYGLKSARYIEYGGSPRASIGLFIAAKAKALLSGKTFVTPQNVKDVAHSVLRHRILLNYEGQIENIKTDDVVSELLAKVPVS